MRFEKRIKNIQVALSNIDQSLTHVLEFGVFTGRTIKYIRENLPKNDFSVFGFDTFTGLPEDWEQAGVKKGLFDCDGNIPDVEDVAFYKGLFKDTIPKYLAEARPIAFIHVDSDLPSSARLILNSLTQNIVKGTVILFDDWEVKGKANESLVFYDWVVDNNIEYEEIEPIIKEGGQKIIKITGAKK